MPRAGCSLQIIALTKTSHKIENSVFNRPKLSSVFVHNPVFFRLSCTSCCSYLYKVRPLQKSTFCVCKQMFILLFKIYRWPWNPKSVFQDVSYEVHGAQNECFKVFIKFNQIISITLKRKYMLEFCGCIVTGSNSVTFLVLSSPANGTEILMGIAATPSEKIHLN